MDDTWMVNEKGFRRKQKSTKGAVPAFSWREWGNQRKISVRIAGHSAEIWGRDLPNSEQDVNHSASTFGHYCQQFAYVYPTAYVNDVWSCLCLDSGFLCLLSSLWCYINIHEACTWHHNYYSCPLDELASLLSIAVVLVLTAWILGSWVRIPLSTSMFVIIILYVGAFGAGVAQSV
jgi:hypothetical protein